MSKTHIELRLNHHNITDYVVTVLGDNKFLLTISGEVYIQQIKELFTVLKWEYSSGKAVFWIEGTKL